MRIFSGRKRPMHLGRYKMEKIKRVDKPTTLITDKVKGVPKRAGFFVRAFYGDLGKKPGEEIRRFITKNPLNAAIGHMHWKHVPMHKGEPCDTKAPLPDDPEELARHIKSVCYFMDADIVGICEVPEWAWFTHDSDGEKIETRHKYAIVLVNDQGWDTTEASTGDDWISGALSYRSYLNGSTTASIVADYIRRLGYPAQAHSNAHGDVMQIPLMLLAGLGEMSRIGEMVLNPFLGPRHKTAVITTDLVLAVDKPIDFGLQDFCDKCKKCARECPAQAIPFGDKVLYNGYEIWKPDVEKCTKYRVTNLKGSACGRCMKMCPWNKEGLLAHTIAMWAAIKLPFTRRFLIWLDDKMGYGIRNPLKRWWLDLEIIGGKGDRKVVKAKSNERELNLDRDVSGGNERIAHYPVEKLPGVDATSAVPLDRKQALRDQADAERALVEAKENPKAGI
ncbi:MAG: reductive dehalogenase [Rhodospirillales bacterium]|nr:reductive dehalogenase [Rhodospirillales bacterium]